MTNPSTPPPASAPTGLASLQARLMAAGAFVAMIATGVGAANGYFTAIVDWVGSSDQTTAQISAIDERLKLIEVADKERIAKAEVDREESRRMAREIERRIEEATRSGSSIVELQERHRALELRVERLDATIEILRENRRSR